MKKLAANTSSYRARICDADPMRKVTLDELEFTQSLVISGLIKASEFSDVSRFVRIAGHLSKRDTRGSREKLYLLSGDIYRGQIGLLWQHPERLNRSVLLDLCRMSAALYHSRVSLTLGQPWDCGDAIAQVNHIKRTEMSNESRVCWLRWASLAIQSKWEYEKAGGFRDTEREKPVWEAVAMLLELNRPCLGSVPLRLARFLPDFCLVQWRSHEFSEVLLAGTGLAQNRPRSLAPRL